MMKNSLELIRYVRNNIRTLIDGLTVSQMNMVPREMKNNIIWNLGHIIFTQQTMCYRLGGYPTKINTAVFSAFASGTIPKENVDKTGISIIKTTFIEILDEFEQDLMSGIFNSYTPWLLHNELIIDNIDDAMALTAVHEGRHYGVIESMVKLIKLAPQ